MVTLTKKDKEYIDSTKGKLVARGIFDHLPVMERMFGKGAPEKVEKEMRRLGYGINFSETKISDKIPTSSYIAFLVTQKYVFNLEEKDFRKIGTETAKLSFLLKFVSKFLVSLEAICENSNVAWKKYYYEGGELHITEVNKEEKKVTAELRDFVGHPVHCCYLEGYFAQIMFFVLGGKVTCREEACPFKDGGDIHRFVITWE